MMTPVSLSPGAELGPGGRCGLHSRESLLRLGCSSSVNPVATGGPGPSIGSGQACALPRESACYFRSRGTCFEEVATVGPLPDGRVLGLLQPALLEAAQRLQGARREQRWGDPASAVLGLLRGAFGAQLGVRRLPSGAHRAPSWPRQPCLFGLGILLAKGTGSLLQDGPWLKHRVPQRPGWAPPCVLRNMNAFF